MGDFIKQHRKLCGILAVLTIILALAAIAGQREPAPPAAVPAAAEETAVPAGKSDKPAGIVRTGSVQNSSGVAITSGFPGQVSELYVADGQTVKAGQPLFKLEPAASEGPAANPGSYDSLLKEYNRLQKLYELGAIPRRQVEAAAARLEAARRNPAGSAAPTGPVTVTAPVDGTVTRLASSSGSALDAGQQAMLLGSGQAVEIVVPLEPRELYLVRLGAPAAVEANGQAIKGKVSSIVPEAQANDVPSFMARITVAGSAAAALKTGMTVQVDIETEQ